MRPKVDEVMRRLSQSEKSGGNDGEATPVPIPNTEVKLSGVDGTWTARSWESRTLPGKKEATAIAVVFFLLRAIG